MAAKTYTLPGTDAAVVVATNGIRASLTLLAKGRSRRAGGYTTRNPERRALWEHLLGHLARSWDERGQDVVATRGGRSDTPAVIYESDVTEAQLRAAYSKAGNYKLDIELTLHSALTDDELAAALDLEEKEGARRLPAHTLWTASPARV
tara:strand:+ start:261 stop:707 length:447 start_codon:yes stop_codon:yes gene_type:complete